MKVQGISPGVTQSDNNKARDMIFDFGCAIYKWTGLTLAKGQLPPNHSSLVSDRTIGIKPFSLTPVLLVRHSEIAHKLRPVSWVVT